MLRIIYTSVLLLTICSFCLSGCGDDAGARKAITPPLPEVPAGINASDGSYPDKIEITWSAAAGASSYRVYKAIVRDDGTTTEFRELNTGDPVIVLDGTTCVDGSVTPSRLYHYKVVAVNEGGASEMSLFDLGYAGPLPKEYLPAPTGLAATQDVMHGVYLRWEPVGGAVSYNVYRSAIAGSGGLDGFTMIGETTLLDQFDPDAAGTDYDAVYDFCDLGPDAPLSEGKGYFYTVVAVDADGDEGEACRSVSGWFPYDVPGSAPANVSATQGAFGNIVRLEWDRVVEASSYLLFRDEAAGVPGSYVCSTTESDYTSQVIEGTAAERQTFDDFMLTADTVYCYFLKAKNSSGTGIDRSDPVVLGWADSTAVSQPLVPTGTAATSDGIMQITVSWSRNAVDAPANVDSYGIYRSQTADGDFATEVGTVADADEIAAYSFTDTTLPATETDYYYKVRAVGPGGTSALSIGAKGRGLPTPPDAPQVSASGGSFYNQIQVSWATGGTSATSFSLFRGTTVDGPWTLLAEGLTERTYVDVDDNGTNNLEYGLNEAQMPYYYKVVPFNAGGEGTAGIDDGYIDLAKPAAPTTADIGGQDISVTWNQIEGSSGYVVEWVRSTVVAGTSPSGTTGTEQVAGNATVTASFMNMALWYNFRFRVRAYVADSGGNPIHYGPWSEWSGWENAD